MNPSFQVITEDIEVNTVTKRVTGVTLTLNSKQITYLRDMFGATNDNTTIEAIVDRSDNRSKVAKKDLKSRELHGSVNLLISMAYEDMKCAKDRAGKLE